VNGVNVMFQKYLPVDRTNRILLIAIVLLIIWTSIELQFTRIWGGVLPGIIRLAISYTGKEWERPVKIEQFDTKGEIVLSTNAGMRIHGGASRAYNHKSLRLYARSEYGNNTFNYSFFGEDERHLYKRLLLRNSGNDYNSTMFRDAYFNDSFVT